MWMLLLAMLPTFDVIASSVEFDLAHAVETAHDRRRGFVEMSTWRRKQNIEAHVPENDEMLKSLDSRFVDVVSSGMPPKRRPLQQEDRQLVWQPGTFSLKYVVMTAAQPSNLTIQFQVCIACGGMLGGEKIRLILPGFTRPPILADDAIVPGGRDAQSFRDITWDQSAETLTLTIASILQQSRQYRVDVPLDAGIQLPVQGVSSQTNIMVSTNAVNGGPAVPIPVEGFALVGSFRDSTELVFEPATAGAAVKITLRFVPVMEILQGELIIVDLPNFSCEEGSCLSSTFTTSMELRNNGSEPIIRSIVSSWRSVPTEHFSPAFGSSLNICTTLFCLDDFGVFCLSLLSFFFLVEQQRKTSNCIYNAVDDCSWRNYEC